MTDEVKVGACKYCGAEILRTAEGELLIKGSWDCIHDPEFLEIEYEAK